MGMAQGLSPGPAWVGVGESANNGVMVAVLSWVAAAQVLIDRYIEHCESRRSHIGVGPRRSDAMSEPMQRCQTMRMPTGSLKLILCSLA
jgi:hypothetical protein